VRDGEKGVLSFRLAMAARTGDRCRGVGVFFRRVSTLLTDLFKIEEIQTRNHWGEGSIPKGREGFFSLSCSRNGIRPDQTFQGRDILNPKKRQSDQQRLGSPPGSNFP